jgi:N6-L-threonylcarbamoyladenine synthase
MITLGIETSCDETSVAILDNEKIISNVIYSQIEHSMYGGVVPEIASRAHLEKIDRLTSAAFSETKLTIPDIDLIAVTDSPGLAGALLVGLSFGLGLNKSWGIPITGVNHLEGHIFSAMLEHPDLQFPFLALVVSGGHTALYKALDIGCYECLGQTVDDAAGEAYDKVGKMLGFAYPAGRAIEEETQNAAEEKSNLSFPVARLPLNSLDFSFSGLKTAVKYYLADKSAQFITENKPQICKAFQNAVISSLVNNTKSASMNTGLKRVAVVGGVACNKQLRRTMAKAFGDEVFFPHPKLCTDNAAMIALCGYKHFLKNDIRFPKMNPSKGI